jgi:hypothetical protein
MPETTQHLAGILYVAEAWVHSEQAGAPRTARVGPRHRNQQTRVEHEALAALRQIGANNDSRGICPAE